jgi:hypothetical protein
MRYCQLQQTCWLVSRDLQTARIGVIRECYSVNRDIMHNCCIASKQWVLNYRMYVLFIMTPELRHVTADSDGAAG